MAQQESDELPFWFDKKKPGATSQQLDAVEQRIGYRLPAALRELLASRNGGVSNFTAYESGEEYFPLLPFLGVEDGAASGTVDTALAVAREFGVPPGVVPFAAQGHSWWGLDYRSTTEPSIVFCLDEANGVQAVADSFDVFLEHLIEE